MEYKQKKFQFVDLFAGIGGFRIALEQLGGMCLGFAEINQRAINVYKKNFKILKHEVELGSVTKISKLPFKVDLIVGGVPCQSWSVAGKMKGFNDPRGRLWLDTIRIVGLNQPKAFVFENVKGLMDPRNKQNLNFIKKNFEKAGYFVNAKLLNSYDFGLPQNRERIFIVGTRKNIKLKVKFTFPKKRTKKPKLFEFINGMIDASKLKKTKFNPNNLFDGKIPVARNRFQKKNELNDFFIFCDTRNGHTSIHSWDITETSEIEKNICMTFLKNRRKIIYGKADGNPISFKKMKDLIPNLSFEHMQELIKKNIFKIVPKKGYEFFNSKNSAGINGIYRIFLPQSDIFSTLTATGTKDYVALDLVSGNSVEEYKKNFIKNIFNLKKFRKISSDEAKKLQGFPENFVKDENDRHAMKQFGNAVSIPVVFSLIEKLILSGVLTKFNSH